jgi:hypothetical protein
MFAVSEPKKHGGESLGDLAAARFHKFLLGLVRDKTKAAVQFDYAAKIFKFSESTAKGKRGMRVAQVASLIEIGGIFNALLSARLAG